MRLLFVILTAADGAGPLARVSCRSLARPPDEGRRVHHNLVLQPWRAISEVEGVCEARCRVREGGRAAWAKLNFLDGRVMVLWK